MAKRKATKTTHVLPVTERALLQRLRRAMREDGDRLIVNRKPWQHEPANVGRFYIVDANGIMTNHNVDLGKLARALGALKPWERLLDDE
jgi:hypothetical protein